jgi:hypothetical protein
MATEGLLALVCAGALLASNPPTPAPTPAEERDTTLAAVLAVQTAMQQGRDYLTNHKPRAAVEVLESQLTRINGNPTYLALLRDAYRAYVQELRLGNQPGLAAVYQQRLQILEPGVRLPITPARSRPPSAALAQAAAAPIKQPTIRGYREEEADPFDQSRTGGVSANDLVAQAELQFSQNKFRAADALFHRARQADPQSVAASKDRWAYCKMYHVVEQLNEGSTAYPSLESELRSALELKPAASVESYGKQLLCEVEKRRGRRPGERDEPRYSGAYQDAGRTPEGWLVAETENFRIYHNLSADWLRKVAEVAERTRADMQHRWFGAVGEPWYPKCELYLHATAETYSRVTGVPTASPGHSSFHLDGARVIGRRIDLHCDDPGMLIAVLPHETTHVVLAGNFGSQPVPRWADEGIAVLTEPSDRIDRHLRNLPKHRQERQLFSLWQLVHMNEYPEPRYVGAFYAESVSLVDFLSHERGPAVFTQFVRDGMQEGYDVSLRRHYGFRDFDELEQRWQAHAFHEAARPAVLSQEQP